MGSSDGEGLSQLYLELVDVYKKRFIPQNGHVAVLKCSPIWKKMRKSFKTLSELSSSSSPRLGTGSYGSQGNRCSLKIEILTRLLFFFI